MKIAMIVAATALLSLSSTPAHAAPAAEGVRTLRVEIRGESDILGVLE